MEFSFFGYARLSRAEASQRRRRAPRAFAATTSRAPLGIGRFAPNIAPSGRGKLTRLGAFAPLFQLTALSSEGAGESLIGSAGCCRFGDFFQGHWRLLETFIVFGDFWRLFGDRLSGGEKVSKQALCGCARGRAPERAGGGAERPRMAQIGAQIRGSGQPARRPFRCQGGCLEEAPNGAAASSRASRGTS
jgi:hypothetical protein